MTSDDALAEGLHESVVTTALLRRLALRPDLSASIERVDPADQADVLASHLGRTLLRSLRTPGDADEAGRLALVRQVLALLDAEDDTPEEGVRRLLALTRPAAPGLPPAYPAGVRPSTPLAHVALLTNAHGDPSLGSEIKAELDTCDRVDLICAFVKWHGMRTLEAQLGRLRERGAPFRVITTTYLGSTDIKALDRLARDFGADIRVQYDPRRTRLHAKGWRFHRATGFDTAYVGSSNLTVSALLDGAEWNVRLSAQATPTLLEKFAATFETYWHSDEYAPYDPDDDADRERLERALHAAKGSGTPTSLLVSGLDVRPYPHQQQILEALDAERTLHDRHRNLVVAATGTGKTVIAALDYRRLCAGRERPSLLFVAHRQEILDQSLRTYREVLADGTFGELLVGGHVPSQWRHVFASVQSLATRVDDIPADAFDVVVVDEFHRAEAPTYRRLLEHLQPRELFGLTATPERTDGTDVRGFFNGRTAAELRVWDAIGADLLSPFHYFGIADGTDLSAVEWRAGRYADAALERLYTGNDARARLVLRQLEDKITDPGRMRALGFCAGVAHAEYMARVVAGAGIPAVAVTGQTPTADRIGAVADLRAGRIAAIFTADLFNEGVDIPEVDTVLFLRPTESPTLFLQQLGRGLRLAEGKAVLTALDFVGHHRAEFRADLRFRALTGASRKDLQRDIEHGFPFLPSGCQIVLDRVVQEEVLRNVRDHLALRWKHLVGELRAHPTDDLRTFLDDTGVELAQVLRPDKSFTTLRRDAGLLADEASPLEAKLARRVRALAHVDDPDRARAYADLLTLGVRYRDLGALEQRLARMLFFALWPDGGGFDSYEAGFDALAGEAETRDELRQVVDLAFDATRHVTTALPAAVPTSLHVHARYTREEILAGLDWGSLARKPAHFQSGVLHTSIDGRPVDAFLITLRKSEAHYSPTTLYRDYPLSPTLFHWESQSTTSLDSPTGRRYLDGSSTILLFVRQERTGEFGTEPYTFLGPAHYVSHTGERPIAITWRLDHAMPADLYADAAVAL
nr:DUF3427 domain-containing protein [Agilicoccus flavus]